MKTIQAGMFLALVVGLIWVGTAKADKDLTLGEAVEAGKFETAQITIDALCGRIDTEATVKERLEQATKRRRCIEEKQALATADSSFETRARFEAVSRPQLEHAKEDEKKEAAENKFLNLNWGLGFGYSFAFDDAIDEATIVDGVVRVTSSKKEEPRVVLEFHRYFWCNDRGRDGTKGCGPFIALAAKDNNVLGGVGLGFMYGRKAAAGDSEGFSVGIGVILDRDVKDLGEGFEPNQPPPGSETAVRFESKSRWGALLFVTRTF